MDRRHRPELTERFGRTFAARVAGGPGRSADARRWRCSSGCASPRPCRVVCSHSRRSPATAACGGHDPRPHTRDRPVPELSERQRGMSQHDECRVSGPPAPGSSTSGTTATRSSLRRRRLVLRGPNGSGKTKALEVLFPFVLDGRIEPRRLNPFAGEDRTMKSNLLYRGPGSAHSATCGWSSPRRDGRPRGRDRRASGCARTGTNDRVTRWYFVADGRVGVDFSLLGADDRPLTRKQLTEEVGTDAVSDRPLELPRRGRRAAVRARLAALRPAARSGPDAAPAAAGQGPRPGGLSRTLTAACARSTSSWSSRRPGRSTTWRRWPGPSKGWWPPTARPRRSSRVYTTYLRTHVRAAPTRSPSAAPRSTAKEASPLASGPRRRRAAAAAAVERRRGRTTGRRAAGPGASARTWTR